MEGMTRSGFYLGIAVYTLISSHIFLWTATTVPITSFTGHLRCG